jgi:DNA-directed RNA polymerase subunit D
MQFENISKVDDRTLKFTLSPIHVSYANTLRRLILTGVETVGFRADMTSTGTTTDVVVKKNDSPMTNEMLAHRIGLLPLNITEPLQWNPGKYTFTLNVTGDTDNITYIKSSDFEVREVTNPDEEPVVVPTSKFFPPNPITGDTCLIAALQPGSNQKIEISAKATVGTGRENARFIPVSQCSYEYSLDTDPINRKEMFERWLIQTKMISESLDETSEKYQELLREFDTMEVKRCYLVDEKNEPYSFDFTVESAGVLPINYIIQRACEVGENMCNRYVNIHRGDLPEEITITSANSRIIGYDFLIRGHDHTLGNLLQTWLVENHYQGTSEPKITYAGYSVPHPLRDEMILRIGVEDGDESTAKKAFAAAASGCSQMFRKMRESWMRATGTSTATIAKPSVRQISAKRPIKAILPPKTS